MFWRTYECPFCDRESEDCYRCSECDMDLVDTETETAGVESL